MENNVKDSFNHDLYVVYCEKDREYDAELVYETAFSIKENKKAQILCLGSQKNLSLLRKTYQKKYQKDISSLHNVFFGTNGWDLYSCIRRYLVAFRNQNGCYTSIIFTGKRNVFDKFLYYWRSTLSADSLSRQVRVFYLSPSYNAEREEVPEELLKGKPRCYRCLWYTIQKVFKNDRGKVKFPKWILYKIKKSSFVINGLFFFIVL